jgi:hypothetical protein
MNADLATAIKTAKYASRYTLGVRRVIPNQDELLQLLNLHMILSVLADPAAYSELTAAEIDELEGILELHL